MERNELVLRVNGPIYELNAKDYGSGLISLSNIVQEICEFNYPTVKIHLVAKDIVKGSFITEFGAYLERAANLFAWENIQTTAAISSVTEQAIKLFNFFRSRIMGIKSTTVINQDLIEIERADGTTFRMHTKLAELARDPKILRNVITLLTSLSRNIHSESIEIRDASNSAMIERSLCRKASEIRNIDSGNEQVIYASGTNLKVVKVDFENKSKWAFYYEGRKISAKVLDSNFVAEELPNLRIGVGDELNVDLEIKQVMDLRLGVFIDKEFTVRNVHQFISSPKPPKQDGLF